MTADMTASERFASCKPGEELGTSPWLAIDQDMVSSFGVSTLDPDPMHVDPTWATAHSPFGRTIAFGFLTASLLTHLLHTALGIESGGDAANVKGHFLNYGFDRLRLVEPVLVGSRIRGRFKVAGVRLDAGGRRFVTLSCHVEIEGHDRPALVAEWLTVWVPRQDA